MILTKDTIKILTSFMNISPHLFVRKGNELRTVDSEHGTQILCIANVEDEFPIDFAIYDLGSFLGVAKMFDNPDVTFHEKYLVISSDQSQVRYLYSAESLIPKAPTKEPLLTDSGIKFDLSSETLSRVMSAAGHMRLPDITIRSKDGHIEIVARDKARVTNNVDDKDTNEFVTNLCEYDGPDFVADYLATNISKAMQVDYEVTISYKKPQSAVLNLQNEKIRYLMTSQASSQFDGEIK